MRTRNPTLLLTNRRPDITQVNFSIDREARALLDMYAGEGRAIGKFLSRLVFEHHARVEERQRLQEVLHSALEKLGNADG